ncbi:hypothetical protein MAXJ12_19348 [Mesorhizobium alhagi CCNWXJ12-2]|uniref:Uncharacterized protein n=1 Tax=Mesorhizobium alhagi CCNWXJ12-2 TaxID=1107882 RepID=H0HUL2_9HYPH|nr:hypothetical protein MAXJ12_19348 [Mesorhizobium alhagi CCNWXJ12-2]
MIGGLVLFGAPGFILGPLTITITLLLVEFFAKRMDRDASHDTRKASSQ